MSDIAVRRAEPRDTEPLTTLYNHYILTTTVTFDLEPKTLAQRGEWLAGFAASGPYQCFVAQKQGRVIGWASSTRFNERAAYDTSVTTSVYLAPGESGRGGGKLLYSALFEGLKGADIHRAYALITLPNDPSEGLHRHFGFRLMGVASEAGRKFDRYWDVAWYEKAL